MTKTKAKIKDLTPFLNPSKHISKAVEDLTLLYQLQNQDAVKLFVKKGNKLAFSGTLGEFRMLQDIRELFAVEPTKPWKTLITVIYLLERYKPNVDVSLVPEMNGKTRTSFFNRIANGVSAAKTLRKWIKPISNGNVLTAIQDAAKVTIGDEHQFQILKIADIPTKSGKVGVFDSILEVQLPDQLVHYLSTRAQPLPDCLIITIQRNEKYDFKSAFTLFLAISNSIYAISNREQRLNLDNTAGARRPDHYLENRYSHVWLPIDLIVGEEAKTTAITIPGSTVKRLASFSDVVEKTPEIAYWLNLFLIRAVDYVRTTKIQTGVTARTVQLMLEDAGRRNDRTRPPTESQADASSFLEQKYASQVTELAVQSPENLLGVISTEKHIAELIQFQRRKALAQELQKLVNKDKEQHFKAIFEWFKTFVKSHDLEETLRKVLLNQEYPRMFYLKFAANEKYAVGLGKERILTLQKGGEFLDFKDETEFNWTNDGEIYTNKGAPYWKHLTVKRVPCQVCRKYEWKTGVKVTFVDYRQICSLFNVKPEQLPREIVEHLHQQNNAYVGNEILDDVDPVDLVRDPWFRNHRGETCLAFVVPICNRCKNRLTHRQKQAK
jgi:hypothetical protein